MRLVLQLEALPRPTRDLFESLRNNSVLRELNLCLFGGTALALRIGHRSSEDLDFFSCEKTLPKSGIQKLIRSLRTDGLSVNNIMDPARITQARINGLDLDDYIQEYSINGVKVSFGTFSKGGESRRLHFLEANRNIQREGSFSLPTLATLFESKAVVLMDRATSRDLFDLMILIKNYGFEIHDVISAIERIDGREHNQAMAALEVLVGNVPIAAADPGFASIKLKMSMDAIYAFFNERVNAYERTLAQQTARFHHDSNQKTQ